MLTKTIKLSNIGEFLLPVTEFRKNFSSVLSNLTAPKLLVKNDEIKAVLIPYDQFVLMEHALEACHDKELLRVAEERIETNTFVDSETFFQTLLEDE